MSSSPSSPFPLPFFQSTMPSFWWSAGKSSPVVWYRVDLPNRRAAKLKNFEGRDVDDLAEAIKEREQLPCPASMLVIKVFVGKRLEVVDENPACGGGEIEVDEGLLREYEKDFGRLIEAYGIDDQNPLVVRLPAGMPYVSSDCFFVSARLHGHGALTSVLPIHADDEDRDLYPTHADDESFDRDSTVFSEFSICDQFDMVEPTFDLTPDAFDKFERKNLVRSVCALQASFVFFEPRWDEQPESQLQPQTESQPRLQPSHAVGKAPSVERMGGLFKQRILWVCWIVLVCFALYAVFAVWLVPEREDPAPEAFEFNTSYDTLMYYIQHLLVDSAFVH